MSTRGGSSESVRCFSRGRPREPSIRTASTCPRGVYRGAEWEFGSRRAPANFSRLLHAALFRAALHSLDPGLRPLPQLLHQLHPAGFVPGDWAGHPRGTPPRVSISAISAHGFAARGGGRGQSLRAEHLQHRRALLRLRHDRIRARGELHSSAADLHPRRGRIHSARAHARLPLHANRTAHRLHVRHPRQPRGHGRLLSHRLLRAPADLLVRDPRVARPSLEHAEGHRSCRGAACSRRPRSRLFLQRGTYWSPYYKITLTPAQPSGLRTRRQQHRASEHDPVAE